MNSVAPLFETRNLDVSFTTPDGDVQAVKNLNISVAAGECLGIVGESGSGKSQTFMAALGLLARNGSASGQALFDGHDLLQLKKAQLRELRGRDIGVIFQDPLTSLTPHMRVGAQMLEVLRLHSDKRGAAAKQLCLDWLDRVRIPESAHRFKQFPHELSGGMRQRVMIAMAMLCGPKLLIADEPTTALDVTVQAQVLDIMDDIKREDQIALALITHDMGVIARMADTVAVMQHGKLVENGKVNAIFERPREAYTKMLLAAAPRPDKIAADLPEAKIDETNLQVENVEVGFPVQRGGLWSKKTKLRAVDDISFHIHPGETLGVVGESGCGKSTLARACLQLIPPTGGTVSWLGNDLTKIDHRRLRDIRKDLTLVFQDPLASLDPRMPVGASIAEPLKIHFPKLSRAKIREKVEAIMERMELDPAIFINRYPHELSGGQNQRIGIARAMIVSPQLLVCDEAVSALDVSVQAQILELLLDLQHEMHMSMMFISHDLAVVRRICHRIMVLYLGRIVELGEAKNVYARPEHPYTRALLEAAPIPDPAIEKNKPTVRLTGDLPSPLDPLAGLRFLKSKMPKAENDPVYRPKLLEIRPGHWVAEHDEIQATA